MAKMRSVQVTKPGQPLALVEKDIPEPGAGKVRVRVEACGICHSDVLTQGGHWPGIEYPRAPGHEIAGVVHAVGSGVVAWKVGQRVGVGWHGGHCGTCTSCRRGDFIACQVALQIPGISYDGGYSEYVIVPEGALALIPEGLSAVEAAPLMCAGVTTYNSLRHCGALPGDLVAILGIGGLGHLGVQFASRMGFRTVGIARGKDKEPLARKLGAWRYIDSESQDPAKELSALGGARVILSTVTSAKAVNAALGGLGVNGTMIVLGAPDESLQVSGIFLLMGRRSVVGWPSGTSLDSQDTMAFSQLSGVRSMNEVYPLEKAPEAFERMMSGKARFRVVLTQRQ
jgi:alcohol dehydrogenase/propanol-preferring alcohol dehydrogenase